MSSTEVVTKVCRGCWEAKPLSEFHKDRTTADGLQRRCKPCHCAASRKWRKEHPDITAAHTRASRQRDPERYRERQQAYRDRNRAKRYAKQAVYRAIRSGRLTRPDYCSRCGRECVPNGHHHDYTKRLEVEWLCHRCHMDTHYGDVPS